MIRPPDWLLALVLIAGVFLWQRTAIPFWHVDLFHIQLASYAWQADHPDKMYTRLADYDQWLNDWYHPQAERLGAWGSENAYYYPPFVAGLLSPVSNVPVSVWRNSLFAVNVLLLFVFAWQIVRLCSDVFLWRGFLWALAVVLMCYPMARAAKLGQIVPLLAVLFWEGLLRLKSSRTIASALLGSVIAIKIFPVGWMLAPLVRKQWRTLAQIAIVGMAVYALSIGAMGLDIHLRWWNAVQEFGSVVFTYFGNQSPAGWFTRAALGHSLQGPNFDPTPTIRFMRLLFSAVFLFGTAIVLWRARKFELPIEIEHGLMISGLLLALPVTWEHYYLFVLPALGALLYKEWRRVTDPASPSGASPRRRNQEQSAGIRIEWQTVLLAAAAFFFLMKLTRFYADDPFGRFFSGSQCLGLILFWIYCLKRVLVFSPNVAAAPVAAE